MVRQNPTIRGCAAAAVVIALVLARSVAAQPFQIVSDGAGGVWVLDEGSGAVSRCGLVTAPGAKLIDVFGAESQVREAPARPARPECELVRGPSETGDGLPSELLALIDSADFYGDDDYAPWWGRMGRWRYRGDVGYGPHRGDVGYARR